VKNFRPSELWLIRLRLKGRTSIRALDPLSASFHQARFDLFLCGKGNGQAAVLEQLL